MTEILVVALWLIIAALLWANVRLERRLTKATLAYSRVRKIFAITLAGIDELGSDKVDLREGSISINGEVIAVWESRKDA